MRMSSAARTLFFMLVGLAGTLGAQTSPSRDQIYRSLIGAWTGHLEYRDFSSNERVILPTWLEVKTSADGRSLEFTYTYDDGPTKTVTEPSTVMIDPASHQYSVTSENSTQTYQMEARDSKNGMQFILTGAGKENDKPVDVRITWIVQRNLYRFTKETRGAGQEFAFRDGYVLTRREPGASR